MKLNHEVVTTSPFQAFLNCATAIAERWWFEGEMGFISMLLDQDEIWLSIIDAYNPQMHSLSSAFPALSDQIIIVPRDGLALRVLTQDKAKLAQNLGIIQMNFAGDGYRILWGFQNDGRPSFLLEMFLAIHQTRLLTDSRHRVVAYAFPRHVQEKMLLDGQISNVALTNHLWTVLPNFALQTPEGIGLLEVPEPLTGAPIPSLTAQFKTYKLVILPQQGVIVSAQTCDQLWTILINLEKATTLSLKTSFPPTTVLAPDYFVKLAKIHGLVFNPEVLKNHFNSVKGKK